MTMRSGCRKSWTAWPSRRNSGFDATVTCSRGVPASASTRCTNRVEPTGTVDLLTTIAFGASTGAISRATLLDEAEVGRAVGALRRLHAQEHDLGARGPRSRRRRRTSAASRRGPPRSSAGRPSSRIGTSPLRRRVDPLGVDVGADDLVAEMGEAGRRGEADVAGADDRDAHREQLASDGRASEDIGRDVRGAAPSSPPPGPSRPGWPAGRSWSWRRTGGRARRPGRVGGRGRRCGGRASRRRPSDRWKSLAEHDDDVGAARGASRARRACPRRRGTRAPGCALASAPGP